MGTFKNILGSIPTALVDIGLNAANDAVGNLINSAFYKRNAQYQFELNEQAAQNAYQRQKAFWDEQNKYNSPSAQVSRLRKAGLNPAILNGGVSGNTAGSLSSVSSGSVSGAPSSSSKSIDFLTHVANRLNLEHLDYENKILSEQLKTHQSDNLRRAIEDGDYTTAHELRMQMLADDREFKRLSNEEKENKIKSDLIELGWKQSASYDGINPIIDDSLWKQAQIATENALRDGKVTQLALDNAAKSFNLELEKQFGYKFKNIDYQMSRQQFHLLKSQMIDENATRQMRYELMKTGLDEAKSNAIINATKASIDSIDYNYYKTLVGDGNDWYSPLGNLFYALWNKDGIAIKK